VTPKVANIKMSNTITTTRRIRSNGNNNESIPKNLIELAKSTYKAKVAKNQASREETNTRKSLYKEMKHSGIKQFQTDAIVDGKKVTLEVDIDAPDRVVVDAATLLKLVDEETFLQIVSATQTAVKEHAGEATLRRCSEVTKGTENVSVNPTKK